MTKGEWYSLAKTYNSRDEELLIRAYNTLMGNVYPSKGYLWSPYRCVSPGINKFRGIWNWDSAFHAVGISRWDTELAEESILGFLQFQRKDGLIPDVIWENNRIVDTFSKPPVFPWAVEIVYKRGMNKAFLETVYPQLVKNENYWAQNRCYKGLFFYDADNKETNDYLIRVKYESGWDNSVRWDKGITEYWAIDLNCFMVMFYRSMAFLADVLDQTDDALRWRQKEKALSEMINEVMWDSQSGHYADTNRFTDEVSDVLTPASFMPLFVQIASGERAEAMNRIAETKFNGKMPTVSFDNPAFSKDYWRGPTWLNVAYFAAKGLKNYHFPVADQIKESILDMVHEEKRGIFENYDSLSGCGQYCDHFSWSCVFINEFIMDF